MAARRPAAPATLRLSAAIHKEATMASQPRPYLTPAEYLAFERRAEAKHEYHDGVIVAMVGASWAHNLIVADTLRELSTSLRGGPCAAVANDLRVWIPGHRIYTYPDIVAVCGEPRFQDAAVDTLLNPALIIEVLSPSTEAYDRGQKFAQYRSIPSLSEYLLVAQDAPRIDYYRRDPDGRWFIGDAHGLDATLDLALGGGCTLRLADLYERVTFPAGPGTEQE
jgi:Uma2 family endonuclease